MIEIPQKIIEKKDGERTMINVGIHIHIPWIQRYMGSYDIETDKVYKGLHSLHIRIGSRCVTHWWSKFFVCYWGIIRK